MARNESRTVMPRMHAMVLERPGAPLVMRERPMPAPGPGEVLIEIAACGVCRTDLHVVDGELPDPVLPLVPGHEIVGQVAALGPGVAGLGGGTRVGVPWLGFTCGVCPYCRTERENLCDRPRFTGYTRDGGYATHTVADARYCFPLPADADPVALAPLLCAGLIGWRSYRMAGPGKTLGIYGFGAAGHMLCQVGVGRARHISPSPRRGEAAARALARRLGAVGAGGSDAVPPEPLDA